VHIAGDLLFFTLIWPHDATRPLVWIHGADATFWLHTTHVIIFGVLAGLAFRQLRRVSQVASDDQRRIPGPVHPRY
jgi:hypothetical protein